MSPRTSARRRWAAALLAPVLAYGLVACGGDADPEPARKPSGTSSLPAPMPDITLEGFDGGEPVNLSEIDTPTVVNLWASWCGPCREEMPVLEEFSQKYAGRIDVLGVDYQDPQQGRAKELVAETGVTYPLVQDLDGALDRLDPFPYVAGLPFMAFVDGEGRMVGRKFVAVDDLAELEELVGEHLPLDAEPAAEPDAEPDEEETDG